MTTTNAKAFAILQVLAGTKEQGRLGFALAKQRRMIETELQEFIAVRNDIIRRHADEHGTITPEEALRANEELAEYTDLPCEFPVCTVDADTFCSGGLTSDQMFDLYFMVEEAEGHE